MKVHPGVAALIWLATWVVGFASYAMSLWSTVRTGAPWSILTEGPWRPDVAEAYIAAARHMNLESGFAAWFSVVFLALAILLAFVCTRLPIRPAPSLKKYLTWRMLTWYEDVLRISPIAFGAYLVSLVMIYAAERPEFTARVRAFDTSLLSTALFWLVALSALLALVMLWRTSVWLREFITFSRNLHRDSRGYFTAAQFEPIPRQRHSALYTALFAMARVLTFVVAAVVVATFLAPLFYLVLLELRRAYGAEFVVTFADAEPREALIAYAYATTLYPNYYSTALIEWVREGAAGAFPMPVMTGADARTMVVNRIFGLLAVTTIWLPVGSCAVLSVAALFKRKRSYAAANQMEQLSDEQLKVGIWHKERDVSGVRARLVESFT